MPGPARLITLNLGSQTFGLAEFRLAPGGLVMVDYRLRELPLFRCANFGMTEQHRTYFD